MKFPRYAITLYETANKRIGKCLDDIEEVCEYIRYLASDDTQPRYAINILVINKSLWDDLMEDDK